MKQTKQDGWKDCEGGICAPLEFLAGAARAGLKKDGLDVALLLSAQTASAAACFTRNLCAAAPVQWSRSQLRRSRGTARAIVVNAGCANAATGAAGLRDARTATTETARLLGVPAASVLVCSTGVIGVPLKMKSLLDALPPCAAGLSREGGEGAAQAITTTDTVLKIESISIPFRDGEVRIGGIAKGAGMIHPDMATMLAFLTTDAEVSPARLQQELSWCVERSFNCCTVDGDTSTNDTVIVLANGASGFGLSGTAGGAGKSGGKRSAVGRRIPATLFRNALLEVCRRLARKVAWDGEGATHHLKIEVRGARTFAQARNVGRSVGRSNLVKTAIYGHDPNWGRVLSAIGASGERIDGSRIGIMIDGRAVAERGVLKGIPDSEFLPVWNKKTIHIGVDLSLGRSEATCWSCDLSHAYVDINGSYRS